MASGAGGGRLTVVEAIDKADDTPELAGTRRLIVGRLADLPAGTLAMVQVDGTDILLANVDGRVYATQGICSHEYFELDRGFLTGDSITCALHTSRFDLATGEALDPPAEVPLATYPVFIEGDAIVLELPVGEIPVNQ